MQNVAVVGAGLAGLAAAVTLVRAGVRVHVYEARAEVGGRMRSDTLEHATLDPSVQLVSSTYTAFFQLARACGAAPLLVRAPGHDALWRNGRAHGITYGSISSMIGSSALPTTLKLRMGARYLPFLARSARALDANDPAGSGGAALDGESIAAWGERELGRDFVELLVYPLLASYYGSLPEQTTAALYHALARVGMDVRVHAVAGGAGALPRALADWLAQQGATLRTDAAVQALHVGEAAARLELADGAHEYDAVIVATPPDAARTLLDGIADVRAWLGGVHSAPTATAAFLLDRPLDPDWFGLSFPRRTEPGARIAAIAAQSRKLGSLVPGGREVVVVYPVPELGARLATAAPQQVVDELMPGLEAAFPGFAQRIVRARSYTFPEGYSVFPPGSLRHLQALRDVRLPSRLALAGDYLVAPSVEGAVRSGTRAAERLLGR